MWYIRNEHNIGKHILIVDVSVLFSYNYFKRRKGVEMFQVLYQLFLSKMKSEKGKGNINKKICRNCNKKFRADYKFCPYCGVMQDQQFYTSKDKK